MLEFPIVSVIDPSLPKLPDRIQFYAQDAYMSLKGLHFDYDNMKVAFVGAKTSTVQEYVEPGRETKNNQLMIIIIAAVGGLILIGGIVGCVIRKRNIAK